MISLILKALEQAGIRLQAESDNGGYYFKCNEQGQDQLIDALSGTALVKNAVHIGFSGSLNYDIIAKKQSEFAIIADIDVGMLEAFQEFTSVIEVATTPKEFVEHFRDGILREELNRTNSWLSSQTSFEYIKLMHEKHKILYLPLNICNLEAIACIAKTIRGCGYTVDTLYISNIAEWLLDSETRMSALKANVQSLQEIGTILIDAFYPIKNVEKESGPPLRFSIGQFPSFIKMRRTPPKKAPLHMAVTAFHRSNSLLFSPASMEQLCSFPIQEHEQLRIESAQAKALSVLLI